MHPPQPQRPVAVVLRAGLALAAVLIVAIAAWSGGIARAIHPDNVASAVNVTTNVLLAVLGLGGIVAIGTIVVLMTREPRRRSGLGLLARPRKPLWSTLVAWFIVLGAMALAVSSARSHHRHPALPRPPTIVSQPTSAATPPARNRPIGSGRGGPGGAMLVAALAGAAALSLGAVALSRRGVDEDTAFTDDIDGEGGDTEALHDSVRSAAAALGGDRTPRDAVIAAYQAMSATLRERGSSTAADTPGRMLRRAVGSGLVRAAEGQLLVRLFERARFSTHPVTDADQQAAETALAAILRSLDDRQVGAVP